MHGFMHIYMHKIIHFSIYASKQNEARGKLVVDVTASYNGKSNEEEFRYSIIHGDTAAFHINEDNGRITTLKSMDREISKSHVVRSFLQWVYVI